MNFFRNYRTQLLKLLVSVSLLGFLFLFADPAYIVESIRNIDIFAYLIALLLYLMAQVVNAKKWHLLLPEVEFLTLLKFTFIGAFYTLILPGQISGELAKVWRLAKGNPIAEQIAASVFVDRVTGFIALLLLSLIGASLSTTDVAGLVVFPAIMVITALFASLFLLRIQVFHAFVTSLAETTMSPFSFLRDQLPKALRVVEQLTYFSNASMRLVVSILIGIVFQVFVVVIARLLAEALGLNIEYVDLAWIMGIISLLIVLPVSISGIGVRELGFVGILSLFGIDTSTAITLSLLLFSLQIIGAAIGAMFELTNQASSENE